MIEWDLFRYSFVCGMGLVCGVGFVGWVASLFEKDKDDDR